MSKADNKAIKAKKMSVTVLTTEESIKAGITSIKQRAKGLNTLVHQVAVSCMAHADKHGDVTLANTLIAELPGSFRKNALIAWFEQYGKFRYNTVSKDLVYIADKKTQLQEAQELPFWLFKPESEYQPFVVQKALESMLKKASKGKEHGDSVPDEFLDDIAALMNKYNTNIKDVLAA